MRKDFTSQPVHNGMNKHKVAMLQQFQYQGKLLAFVRNVRN